jgi:hypothetical protein
MKQENSRLKNPFLGLGAVLSRTAQRAAIGAFALMLGLSALNSAPCAAASPIYAPPRAAATPICAASALRQSPPDVYLYDTAGTPVLATNASVTTEGGVYTDTEFVGTIDAAGWIVDVSGAIVGYVDYRSPDGV